VPRITQWEFSKGNPTARLAEAAMLRRCGRNARLMPVLEPIFAVLAGYGVSGSGLPQPYPRSGGVLGRRFCRM
jgi:hypothetical protein